MFLFSDKIIGQCPTFEFWLSEPYYESLYGAFAIDVSLNDFANYHAAGIDLEISYSNTDIHIIESTTEESLLSVIKTGLGASFNFSAGVINLGGIQPPLDEGAVVTGVDEEIIFTIYFTAVAGECVDFSFVSTDVIVSFPLIPDFEFCEGGVGLNCEIDDYCMPSFTLAGLIENPVLDCVDAEDGGVPGVLVEINEAQEIEDYDCMAITYANGDYECSVIGGLDYRITPIHDYNRSCGLTSLDIDIIQDHILQSDCITDLWSFLAADVNESGTITTSDNSAIQGAILNTDVD
ncbi:MAG: hypothetical protein M3R25_05445 [Bacteroidota bacterium]|nr:hypothetical protein [Bacteroidota bacterium]